MERTVKGIACYEEPIMWKIAEKLYRHIHPDVATTFAVLSSAVAFVLYLGTVKSPNNYLWIGIPVGVHWLCDGIDGKIAKLRQTNRKNGGLIDKASDCISSVLFISGFFYASTKSMWSVGVFLTIYFIVYLNYLRYYFVKKMDVIFGGTEGRIVLIALNVVVWIQRSFM